ncbi:MAG: hypothetical protein LBL00_05935 [Endomicrobium sp.]|jgi:hypothetical protein|nr:hypothetical protein [Endomicrobium sp.]
MSPTTELDIAEFAQLNDDAAVIYSKIIEEVERFADSVLGSQKKTHKSMQDNHVEMHKKLAFDLGDKAYGRIVAQINAKFGSLILAQRAISDKDYKFVEDKRRFPLLDEESEKKWLEKYLTIYKDKVDEKHPLFFTDPEVWGNLVEFVQPGGNKHYYEFKPIMKFVDDLREKAKAGDKNAEKLLEQWNKYCPDLDFNITTTTKEDGTKDETFTITSSSGYLNTARAFVEFKKHNLHLMQQYKYNFQPVEQIVNLVISTDENGIQMTLHDTKKDQTGPVGNKNGQLGMNLYKFSGILNERDALNATAIGHNAFFLNAMMEFQNGRDKGLLYINLPMEAQGSNVLRDDGSALFPIGEAYGGAVTDWTTYVLVAYDSAGTYYGKGITSARGEGLITWTNPGEDSVAYYVNRYLQSMGRQKMKGQVHSTSLFYFVIEWVRMTTSGLVTTEGRYSSNVSRMLTDMFSKIYEKGKGISDTYRAAGFDWKLANIMMALHYINNLFSVGFILFLPIAVIFSSYAFLMPFIITVMISTILMMAINLTRFNHEAREQGDLFRSSGKVLKNLAIYFAFWVAIQPIILIFGINAANEIFKFLNTYKEMKLADMSVRGRFQYVGHIGARFGIIGYMFAGLYAGLILMLFLSNPVTWTLGLWIALAVLGRALLVAVVYIFASAAYTNGLNVYSAFARKFSRIGFAKDDNSWQAKYFRWLLGTKKDNIAARDVIQRSDSINKLLIPAIGSIFKGGFMALRQFMVDVHALLRDPNAVLKGFEGLKKDYYERENIIEYSDISLPIVLSILRDNTDKTEILREKLEKAGITEDKVAKAVNAKFRNDTLMEEIAAVLNGLIKDGFVEGAPVLPNRVLNRILTSKDKYGNPIVFRDAAGNPLKGINGKYLKDTEGHNILEFLWAPNNADGLVQLFADIEDKNPEEQMYMLMLEKIIAQIKSDGNGFGIPFKTAFLDFPLTVENDNDAKQIIRAAAIKHIFGIDVKESFKYSHLKAYDLNARSFAKYLSNHKWARKIVDLIYYAAIPAFFTKVTVELIVIFFLVPAANLAFLPWVVAGIGALYFFTQLLPKRFGSNKSGGGSGILGMAILPIPWLMGRLTSGNKSLFGLIMQGVKNLFGSVKETAAEQQPAVQEQDPSAAQKQEQPAEVEQEKVETTPSEQEQPKAASEQEEQTAAIKAELAKNGFYAASFQASSLIANSAEELAKEYMVYIDGNGDGQTIYFAEKKARVSNEDFRDFIKVLLENNIQPSELSWKSIPSRAIKKAGSTVKKLGEMGYPVTPENIIDPPVNMRFIAKSAKNAANLPRALRKKLENLIAGSFMPQARESMLGTVNLVNGVSGIQGLPNFVNFAAVGRDIERKGFEDLGRMRRIRPNTVISVKFGEKTANVKVKLFARAGRNDVFADIVDDEIMSEYIEEKVQKYVETNSTAEKADIDAQRAEYTSEIRNLIYDAAFRSFARDLSENRAIQRITGITGVGIVISDEMPETEGILSEISVEGIRDISRNLDEISEAEVKAKYYDAQNGSFNALEFLQDAVARRLDRDHRNAKGYETGTVIDGKENGRPFVNGNASAKIYIDAERSRGVQNMDLRLSDPVDAVENIDNPKNKGDESSKLKSLLENGKEVSKVLTVDYGKLASLSREGRLNDFLKKTYGIGINGIKIELSAVDDIASQELKDIVKAVQAASAKYGTFIRNYVTVSAQSITQTEAAQTIAALSREYGVIANIKFDKNADTETLNDNTVANAVTQITQHYADAKISLEMEELLTGKELDSVDIVALWLANTLSASKVKEKTALRREQKLNTRALILEYDKSLRQGRQSGLKFETGREAELMQSLRDLGFMSRDISQELLTQENIEEGFAGMLAALKSKDGESESALYKFIALQAAKGDAASYVTAKGYLEASARNTVDHIYMNKYGFTDENMKVSFATFNTPKGRSMETLLFYLAINGYNIDKQLIENAHAALKGDAALTSKTPAELKEFVNALVNEIEEDPFKSPEELNSMELRSASAGAKKITAVENAVSISDNEIYEELRMSRALENAKLGISMSNKAVAAILRAA